MKLKDPDNPTLEEVADLCRAAHDEILIHGHSRRTTVVGYEASDGLCIGSALAKAAGMKSVGVWSWDHFAGSQDLCPAGQVFSASAKAILQDSHAEIQLSRWNDKVASEQDALDLLMNVEKDLREQAASASTA